MTNNIIMTANEISFAKQYNGYNREQVDRYIESITNAYRSAYNEYTEVCAKHSSLLNDYKELSERLAKQQESSTSNVDTIAKALVDTEALVKKIIADAQVEADKIREQAQADSERIKDAAYEERAVAKIQTQKILEDANAEATAAREEAGKLLGDARAEAAMLTARAKRNTEQADESITQLIDKLHGMMTPKTIETQPAQATELQTLEEFIAGHSDISGRR